MSLFPKKIVNWVKQLGTKEVTKEAETIRRDGPYRIEKSPDLTYTIYKNEVPMVENIAYSEVPQRLEGLKQQDLEQEVNVKYAMDKETIEIKESWDKADEVIRSAMLLKFMSKDEFSDQADHFIKERFENLPFLVQGALGKKASIEKLAFSVEDVKRFYKGAVYGFQEYEREEGFLDRVIWELKEFIKMWMVYHKQYAKELDPAEKEIHLNEYNKPKGERNLYIKKEFPSFEDYWKNQIEFQKRMLVIYPTMEYAVGLLDDAETDDEKVFAIDRAFNTMHSSGKISDWISRVTGNQEYIEAFNILADTKLPRTYLHGVGSLEKFAEPMKEKEEETIKERLKQFFSEKGQCYMNAWHWVDLDPSWTLVHGKVFNPSIGREMGHAWCEKGDVVLDATHKVTLPKDVYYALGKISYTKRYTHQEAMDWAVKVRTYGPWDDEIDSAVHEGKSLWQKHKKKEEKNKRISLTKKAGVTEQVYEEALAMAKAGRNRIDAITELTNKYFVNGEEALARDMLLQMIDKAYGTSAKQAFVQVSLEEEEVPEEEVCECTCDTCIGKEANKAWHKGDKLIDREGYKWIVISSDQNGLNIDPEDSDLRDHGADINIDWEEAMEMGLSRIGDKEASISPTEYTYADIDPASEQCVLYDANDVEIDRVDINALVDNANEGSPDPIEYAWLEIEGDEAKLVDNSGEAVETYNIPELLTLWLDDQEHIQKVAVKKQLIKEARNRVKNAMAKEKADKLKTMLIPALKKFKENSNKYDVLADQLSNADPEDILQLTKAVMRKLNIDENSLGSLLSGLSNALGEGEIKALPGADIIDTTFTKEASTHDPRKDKLKDLLKANGFRAEFRAIPSMTGIRYCARINEEEGVNGDLRRNSLKPSSILGKKLQDLVLSIVPEAEYNPYMNYDFTPPSVWRIAEYRWTMKNNNKEDKASKEAFFDAMMKEAVNKKQLSFIEQTMLTQRAIKAEIKKMLDNNPEITKEEIVVELKKHPGWGAYFLEALVDEYKEERKREASINTKEIILDRTYDRENPDEVTPEESIAQDIKDIKEMCVTKGWEFINENTTPIEGDYDVSIKLKVPEDITLEMVEEAWADLEIERLEKEASITLEANLKGKMPALIKQFKSLYKGQIAGVSTDEDIEGEIEEVNEQFDPTSNAAEYTSWIIKNVYTDEVADKPSHVKKVLDKFHMYKKRKTDMDKEITHYKDFESLEAAVENAELGGGSAKEKKGADFKVEASDDTYVVQRVFSPKYIYDISKTGNIAWCTGNDMATARDYVDVTRKGPLYYILKKGRPFALLNLKSGQLHDIHNEKISLKDYNALLPLLESIKE